MTQRYAKKGQRGFALIYVMVILTTIIAAVALAASLSATFAGNRIRSYTNVAQVRMIEMSCAESLMMQVRSNTALVVTGSMNISGGLCNYQVSGSNPTKTVTLTASSNYIYKRLIITTTQLSPTIISRWQETN